MRTSSSSAFLRTTSHVAFRLLRRAPGPRPIVQRCDSVGRDLAEAQPPELRQEIGVENVAARSRGRRHAPHRHVPGHVLVCQLGDCRSAAHWQAIESNPLSPDELAMLGQRRDLAAGPAMELAAARKPEVDRFAHPVVADAGAPVERALQGYCPVGGRPAMVGDDTVEPGLDVRAADVSRGHIARGRYNVRRPECRIACAHRT